MKTIKEIRKIDKQILRQMCISNKWYTRGTNKDYEHLFEMCDIENVTTKHLLGIALDIYTHSDIKSCSTIYEDYSFNDNITNLMSYVADCCYSLFIWIE